MNLITVHSMEDSIEMNSSAEINLGEASESEKIKDHEIGFQQSYAQTNEHEDDYKEIPSLQPEGRCKINDRSGNYWDTYEEINDTHG